MPEPKALSEARSSAEPKPAPLVAGHTLVRKIGEGAMAEVFEAWDQKGDTVALKILKPDRAADPEHVRDFQNEAAATGQVVHENVVKILGSGFGDGRHFIRMELVNGPVLADLLSRGRLEWKRAVSIAKQVARALAHAHSMGFVHRDVKPENILLYKDGRARLTDFGIVKDVSTLKGYLLPARKIGTPAYASPEQCLGRRLSPATDVYSLGATLYHMVAGRPPFGASPRSEVMRRQVHEAPTPPLEIVPDLPKALSNLVERMLGKRVADRPADMAKVISDLEMIEAGKVPILPTRRRP